MTAPQYQKRDGQTYAPQAATALAVVKPGEFPFAAVALDHGHIFGQVQGLLEAGGTLKWAWDPQPARLAAFCERFKASGVRPAQSLEAVLADPEVRLVAAAAVPCDRAPLGLRVLDAGKDYFTDKSPFTTLEQLAAVRAKVRETGRKYMVYYSERLHTEAGMQAGDLIQAGAIGDILNVNILAPHRLSAPTRPAWFWDKRCFGGIITDIGSHQFEQFLHYTGATGGVINYARVANRANPDHPGFEDFGEAHFTANTGASCYMRVDWFTPDGLPVWGDGRVFIAGTKGYIEIRKYIDITQPGNPSQRIYLADGDGVRLIECAGKAPFHFFGNLILDCIERTERAMTQEHAFLAAELSMCAQEIADRGADAPPPPPARTRRKTVQWTCTTPEAQWQGREARAGHTGGGESLRLLPGKGPLWTGFGGCFNEMGQDCLRALPETVRQEILRTLFDPQGDSCRFDYCRVPIGANDYALDWYSLADTPDDLAMDHFSIERDRGCLIPFIRSAQALQPALRLFASPWSPPAWMKHPRAYNHGTLVDTEANLRAYALYLLKFVQAYQAEGIPVEAVHVQNEPHSDQKFPSCVWTGEQMGRFIRDHLGPLFETEGHPAQIWAGTVERDTYDAFILPILADAATRRHVAGLGFQWAGKAAVQRTRDAWPDLPLIQTENECAAGENTWADASHTFALMRHYIRNGASAYVYWNMVLPPGGMSTWGWHQNALVTVDKATKAVTYNPEFHVMRHLSRYVTAGARAVETAGEWAANTIAFRQPDGSLVLAVHNPLGHDRHFESCAAAGGISATLPPHSFNTFVIES